MSEPANDMSLRDPQPLRLVYEPLGEYVPHREFATYEYVGDAWRYRMTHDVVLAIPAHLYALREQAGMLWCTFPGRVEVDAGYCWDGPSGPAINDESSVVGSLLHDICCTRAADGRYPCSYWTAHRLYRQVNRAQGMHAARAWYQWGALAACNWIIRLDDR